MIEKYKARYKRQRDTRVIPSIVEDPVDDEQVRAYDSMYAPPPPHASSQAPEGGVPLDEAPVVEEPVAPVEVPDMAGPSIVGDSGLRRSVRLQKTHLIEEEPAFDPDWEEKFNR